MGQNRENRESFCPRKFLPLKYLQEDDRVVETTLRFCAKKNCVTNIKNSKISVRNLNTMIIIPAETLVLSEIERQNIMEEGFIIS